MNTIHIGSIKPSPDPIRKTWDESKLDELAQSIKEQGLIVPIKVRPNWKPCPYHGYTYYTNSGLYSDDADMSCCWDLLDDDVDPTYEVVYGHRRLEACRRAGVDEVEAIVEGVDDTNTLIQSLIENVQREDMTNFDEGLAYLRMKNEFGLSVTEIARRITKDHAWISRLISLVQDEASQLFREHDHDHDVNIKSQYIRKAFGDDVEARKKFTNKVIDEGLSREQTLKVADSISATQDPKRREALLNTPYSTFIHDPEMNRERAEKYGASDPIEMDKTPSPGALFEMTVEVKMIIDYLKTSRKQMVGEVRKMYEVGKFSPEAVPFILREARMMVQKWQELITELEADNE